MSENFVILAPTGTRASIATYVQQALQKIGMTAEVKTAGVGTMYG